MGKATLEITDLWTGPLPPGRRGVSFVVHAGEALAVLGDKGAGKSQLLRCIGLEIAPSAGRVLLDGVDVTEASAERRRQLRADSIELVHPPVPAEGSAGGHAVRRSLLVHRTGATMPVTGLRQRIQLARALSHRAAVLLVDEPFVGVDQTVRDRIRDLLRRVRTEVGTAVVLATGDPEVARELSQNVVVLDDGEIVERGPTAIVLDAPRDARTRALLSARRSA